MNTTHSLTKQLPPEQKKLKMETSQVRQTLQEWLTTPVSLSLGEWLEVKGQCPGHQDWEDETQQVWEQGAQFQKVSSELVSSHRWMLSSRISGPIRHQSQRPYIRSSKPYSKWDSMNLTSSPPLRNMVYTLKSLHSNKRGLNVEDYQHTHCKMGKDNNLELLTLEGRLGSHVTMTLPWERLNVSFSKLEETYSKKDDDKVTPGPWTLMMMTSPEERGSQTKRSKYSNPNCYGTLQRLPLKPGKSMEIEKPLGKHSQFSRKISVLQNERFDEWPLLLKGSWIQNGDTSSRESVRKTLKLNSLFFFIYFRPREPKCDSKRSQIDHGNNNSHAHNYSIVYAPVRMRPRSTIKHSKIYVT